MNLTILMIIILGIFTALFITTFLLREKVRDIQVEDALLSPEELVKHAVELGRSHTAEKDRKNLKLLMPRLSENFSYITHTYSALNDDARRMKTTVPAAEWLLDNYYIIEEQFRDIKNCISKGDYSRLPVLKKGYLRGFPRVYAVALEIVSHSDGSIDETVLINFIKAYQSQSLLEMEELWAFAIMLRIALIEKIRHTCEKISDSRNEWNKAEELAELIISSINDNEIQISTLLREKLGDELTNSFVEHLLQVFRKKGIKAAFVLQYLDNKLSERNSSIEKATESEHQVQAAVQVSIGNSISSLRAISSLDWNDIFESLSHVEMILNDDPAGIYSRMDFESRDYYRHTIEKLATACSVSEVLIAKKAVECALERLDTSQGKNASRHVGYYLIGNGRSILEKKIGRGMQGIRGLAFSTKRLAVFTYLGLIAFVTFAAVLWLGYYAAERAITRELFWGIVAAVAVLIPVSDIVITLINIIISHGYRPTIFPKLELKEGIPEDSTTMVIIPTLLPNEKRVKELIQQMEVIYLANQDKNLYFALVGDYKDSTEKDMPDDEKIAKTALEGIKMLNERYSSREKDRFFYFHRQRTFNNRQGKWMGWERKRGAIIEFNEILRGSQQTNYSIISGDVRNLPRIRYIITLDADTNLPMGAAKRLIGTISHPMNRAIVDRSKGRVVDGYGLLQPRISVSISSANSTVFSRIFAGQGGIDPYTTAISDVYQDLFGEGIFTGKGIYELDVFQELLKDSIPDNTVLSHDLLEGSYVRVGLVTDIEMVDGYPARYNSSAMRLHRWVRGDWQLLPWLMSRVKNRHGDKVKNPITTLSTWKIIDNLRRSLLNPALLLLILLGLSVLPGDRLLWLGLALFTVFSPVWSYILNNILSINFSMDRSRTHSTVISGLRAAFYQSVLLFAFIPYQAYLMLDAIIKTLGRVLFTRKNMLEWVTAADMEANLKNDLVSFWKRMWVSAFIGFVAFALSAVFSPEHLVIGSILLAVWAGSPFIAYEISRPYKQEKETLSRPEIQKLRRLARKTWAYYEDFAGEEDNFLPPDNYQEEPTRVVAHRTSPTNIGFLLMAIVSARDLGFIGTLDMLRRIDRTVATMEKMEKWNGHLYNWYDTLNLNVLRPYYVSTVDSGNLIGYLMVVEQAIKEYMSRSGIDVSLIHGISDLIDLISEERGDSEPVVDTSLIEEMAGKVEITQDDLRNVVIHIKSEMEIKNSKNNIQEYYWGKKLLACIDMLKEEIKLVENCKNIYVDLLERTKTLVNNMEFKPLFDNRRQLFSIGYNVEEGHLSKSYYDLLASEARQASYIAVARGEVDQRHWFRLGRKLASVEGYKSLVSWTGTMFEYLMPPLIMKSYENTLLDETYAFVLKSQKRYASHRGIPWGVSESGFYAFDMSLNYQYRAFGIPELGLKRGLENDIVIAPYASVLAVGLDPAGMLKNIERLETEGMGGLYGLYEAIDYTPSRLQRDEKSKIVKSFMAHHQGMSLVALNNFINRNIMQARFHSNPLIRSAELLLQEKVPAKVTFTKDHRDVYIPPRRIGESGEEVIRSFGIPDSPLPHVHMLSNGNYSIMITNGGAGYSRVHDIAVSRWSRDFRGYSKGIFIFVQNLNSNDIWSATYEPLNTVPESYRTVFSPDKAEFIRKDGNIETHTEITVSPEDNAEIRRVTLTNYGQHARELELTSYFEVVLTQHDADIAHPAFSNLFIRTEYLDEYGGILASRRPRSERQRALWAVHTVTVEGEATGQLEYETDRSKFIGRNRNLSNPLALDVNQPLSNTVGAVLDPIMSLRRRVRVEPGKSVKVFFVVAMAENRKKAVELADKYHEIRSSSRAFELAWTRSQIEADYLGLKSGDVETYLEMIPSILFTGNLRRGWADIILHNKKGQSDLWPYGISGDLPLVLLCISSKDDIDLVNWTLKAHEFWRVKGLQVDVVILLEDESSYTQPLHDACRDAISSSHARELIDRRGGVFIKNGKQMPLEDVTLLYTVARIVLRGGAGPVREQLRPMEDTKKLSPFIKEMSTLGEADCEEESVTIDRHNKMSGLIFYNGIGGFSPDGREYIMCLCQDQHTPAPWINVISNHKFGFNVTESGGGFTWSENSRENKLTPWSNDPVTDLSGEVVYIRDDHRGAFWSVTPEPIRQKCPYIIRHGQGYSVFEHTSHGLEQSLTVFVSVEHSVKIGILKLKNLSKLDRKLSIFYYTRPVLGVNDEVTAQYVTTGLNEASGGILIENSYNTEFKGRIGFIDSSEPQCYCTGDRLEFLGINGNLKKPEALRREHLSGRVGAGYDPCAALQMKVGLGAGEEKELVLLLGQSEGIEELSKILTKFKNVAEASAEFIRVKEFWRKKLDVVQVSTPDMSLNVMLNGWLLYQVISCRLWARSAFYQSGGAYGFRDQLQDVMAAIYTWPELARRQILLHSAHQFIEGDVQHWWHAEAGKGIRTKYSDDLVWLAYVTADYIENTGDWAILDEEASYLESAPLGEHEDERYEIPRLSQEKSSIYEHCIRVLERSLGFGEHGIPLMGCGDWNDGMNTVGNKGKGESVWLGWFIYTTLLKFIPVCRYKNDTHHAERYEEMASKIADALEKNAWDGGWYRRAYFDDGKPLGASINSECRIDSISQSWSAISGVGKPARVKEAMNAVEKYLIDTDDGIIKLLTPPFDKGDLEPGYIKGYVPGVRENGGQYTHAAVWVILAFTKLGMGDKAWQLFNMINPVNHTRTSIEYNRYKLEPYVMAADVYAVAPHTGRGGWSWYTGAAGWMYRVGIEHILGIKKRGNTLLVDPCIPGEWKEYMVEYRHGDSEYRINVKNPGGVSRGVKSVTVDGIKGESKLIQLADDGKKHTVEVILG